MRWFALLTSFVLGCGSEDHGLTPAPSPTNPVAVTPTQPSAAMFKPLPSRLTSQVFENEFLKIPPTLVFGIELPLEPFNYGGRETRTEVRLDHIRFAVTALRELAGREFRFPVNPSPGYIDGSVYVGDAHDPADVTRIKFGSLSGGKLPAEIDIQFDFEYEGNDELGKPHFTWNVMLDLDPKALEKVAEGFKK